MGHPYGYVSEQLINGELLPRRRNRTRRLDGTGRKSTVQGMRSLPSPGDSDGQGGSGSWQRF